jgi:hypothetical protein
VLQVRIGPDLRVILVNLIEDRLVGGFAEATLFPGLNVVFESGAESFWTIVESISKRFMDTFYGVSTGHEDLRYGQFELLALAGLAKIISLVRKPLSMHGGA